MNDPDSARHDEGLVDEQEREAAREAAAIGGRGGDYETDEAGRPLAEAGQGEAEGFELAEADLVQNASHEEGSTPDPTHLAGEPEDGRVGSEYGEPDEPIQSDSADSPSGEDIG
jgi:hypothetical protein